MPPKSSPVKAIVGLASVGLLVGAFWGARATLSIWDEKSDCKIEEGHGMMTCAEPKCATCKKLTNRKRLKTFSKHTTGACLIFCSLAIGAKKVHSMCTK
ncbi:MAG: hypothetical protein Edafosvirus2_6 [Edafosvirus sp.]|uniref:Uncharacterized protein n=1 Tax=Edafosvirus sp. TaxID=2487765 RepID=A0A3G4ZSF6_9VIRU|nr:MAG: hypothetical protein Edafosvirus2_6 [Edafosvirus sp.]